MRVPETDLLALSRLKLCRAVAAVVLAWPSVPAAADYCLQVDEETGRQAVELIRKAGELVYEDWEEPVEVETVEWADGSVRVNGQPALDLAYVYIPRLDDTYENPWLESEVRFRPHSTSGSSFPVCTSQAGRACSGHAAGAGYRGDPGGV